MLVRSLILLALVAALALPFALRPAASPGAADDTVVIITPHNEAIRQEISRAFAEWYRAKTGRTVRVDWRVVGGTSDIARFLEGAYAAAFEREWAGVRHQPWSTAIQTGFQSARLGADAPTAVQAARAAFLESQVGCGIDVFFGGDAYQFTKEAAAGRLVESGLAARYPEWFRDDVFPLSFGGEPLRDAGGRWFGVVLSRYGILFNRDALRRLGVRREPSQWTDLANPQLLGAVGLADPTKSGSVCEAFENILQQQMQRRLAELGSSGATTVPSSVEERAVSDGWVAGLRLIQALGANARYFTDSSQKPPIDVANGDCAAGLCIDFYGRQQEEAVRQRLGYVAPAAGSAVSADPIGLLRGAPHQDVAVAFLEFALSMEGQKVWAFKAGVPGGPTRYALRRMPVRRDFYAHSEWKRDRSDPGDDPYGGAGQFVYHERWTGGLFREIGFVTRVMCLDAHPELVRAWRAIAAAPKPARSQALAVLQQMDGVAYDRVAGEIHRRLNAKDRVEEVRLTTELGAYFRANYERAEEIAREK
jgi:ABC-type Fe3+ transport system substrate-binding protein